MASLTMAQLVLMGMLLMSFLPKYTIAQLRPMCISQFALANQACAVLRFTDAPSDRNNTNRIQVASDNDNDDDDDDDNNDDDDPDEPEHDNRQGNRNGNRTRRGNRNSNGQRQGNRNGNGQRHRNGNGNRQRHGHGHGNGHGSRHGHGGGHGDDPRVNRDCCRWLDEVDESCVCTALLRLPPFLVKPKHRYFIKVGDTCDRTFDCHGA